jgi:hypothetical protein
VRELAVAIFAGLLLVAAAIAYAAPGGDADQYADSEEIARAFGDVLGVQAVAVERVGGPFVRVKLRSGECVLLDVSTRFDGESSDQLWIAQPTGETKSLNC